MASRCAPTAIPPTLDDLSSVFVGAPEVDLETTDRGEEAREAVDIIALHRTITLLMCFAARQ